MINSPKFYEISQSVVPVTKDVELTIEQKKVSESEG
jgi:hypothetical protein